MIKNLTEVKSMDFRNKIYEILREELGQEESFEIDDNMLLKGDLDMDSLDVISIISRIEDEFDVEVPEGAASKVRTVGDIVSQLSEL